MTGRAQFSNVEEYIAIFPEKVQTILQKLRETLQKAVPGAEEVISYGIPAFKYHGMLIYFSAYKEHISLSVPMFTLFEVFKEELAPYKQSKSTIQFPLDKPFPYTLAKKLAQYRAKENLEAESAKKAAKSNKRK